MPPPVPPMNPQNAPPSADIPMDEVQRGKLFAVLSYACCFVAVPFFIVPLVMRDNAFSLFHAKQVLVLALCSVVVSILAFLLTFICIGPFIALGWGIFAIVLIIVGLINVSNNQAKPLPLLGSLGESLFAGIRKQQI